MIEYKFLYYVSPEKYRFRLDGDDEDPNLDKIKGDEKIFGDEMFSASLEDYITTIIRIFSKVYPNDTLIKSAMIDYDIEDLKALPEKVLREENDISRIDFEYKFVSDEDQWEQYLHSLKITFTDSQSKLDAWIKKGLAENNYNKSTDGTKSIYEVKDSPILKIEVEDKTLMFFIDKSSYIMY